MHEKTAHEGYKRPDKSKSDHHVIEHGDRKFLWTLSTDTKSTIYIYVSILHIFYGTKIETATKYLRILPSMMVDQLIKK